MTTAVNIGRINVWPTYDDARAAALEADTVACEAVGQLTVWRTNAQARAHLTSEGGGEGGGPEWVPDNAKIYIDLVNNRAWTEADGEVAIDTLLGSDPNTDSLWDETEYDPSGLTADGYVYTGTDNAIPLAFTGGLRDDLLSGGTISIRTKQLGESQATVALIVGAADGNDAVQINFLVVGTSLNATSYGGSLELAGTNVGNIGVGAINCQATTLVADRLDMSANGEAGVTAALLSADRPPGNPFVAVVLDTEAAVQSITLYDALPDTTGLSELSEAG